MSKPRVSNVANLSTARLRPSASKLLQPETGSRVQETVNAPGEGDLALKANKLQGKSLAGDKSSIAVVRGSESQAPGRRRRHTQSNRLSVLDVETNEAFRTPEILANWMERRWDSKFHDFVCRLTESDGFNHFIMAMIIFNTIVLAFETSPSFRYRWQLPLAIIDQGLLAIYTVEAILRIYAEPKNYWLHFSNVFDFLLVVVSLCQPVIELFVKGAGGVMVFRMFRALKALRTLRSVSFSTNLKVLVSALIDTIRRYVISVIVLLAFIMFLFGVVGYYLFGSNKQSVNKEALADWGRLDSAMLSLFTYVTADGWTTIQSHIDHADDTGKWSRLFTIGFICIGHFIMTNVFIGIIIMNISEATETFRQERKRERERAVRRKKAFMMKRQREDINSMVEKQRRGNWNNFYEMVQSYRDSLNHSDFTYAQDMCANPAWLEIFLTSLDKEDQTWQSIIYLHMEILNKLGALADGQK